MILQMTQICLVCPNVLQGTPQAASRGLDTHTPQHEKAAATASGRSCFPYKFYRRVGKQRQTGPYVGVRDGHRSLVSLSCALLRSAFVMTRIFIAHSVADDTRMYIQWVHRAAMRSHPTPYCRPSKEMRVDTNAIRIRTPTYALYVPKRTYWGISCALRCR